MLYGVAEARQKKKGKGTGGLAGQSISEEGKLGNSKNWEVGKLGCVLVV
jgi:hypothetical protein